MSKPTPKRWFRFSLRTLLVLVTLFSVLLGYWAFRHRERTRAITAIELLGGRIHYVADSSTDVPGETFVPVETSPKDASSNPAAQSSFTMPEWLRYLLDGPKIRAVGFHGDVTDNDLSDIRAHLEKLPNFDLLSFGATQITDRTVAEIAPLRNFRFLNIDGTDVTDAAIEHVLEMPQLEALSIVFADGISIEGLRRLRDHPRLLRVSWNRKSWDTPEPVEAWDAAWKELRETLQERASSRER